MSHHFYIMTVKKKFYSITYHIYLKILIIIKYACQQNKGNYLDTSKVNWNVDKIQNYFIL